MSKVRSIKYNTRLILNAKKKSKIFRTAVKSRFLVIALKIDMYRLLNENNTRLDNINTIYSPRMCTSNYF